MDEETITPKPIKRHVAPSRPKKGQSHSYYVGQAELRAEIQKYFDSGTDASNRVISNELAEMLIKIATRFATKSCFYRYTYKQEFIDEAIYRMVLLLGKINLNLPNCNPFSYLTQICYSTFVLIIKKNNKATKQLKELRNRIYEDFCTSEGISSRKELTDLIYSNGFNEGLTEVFDKEQLTYDEEEDQLTKNLKTDIYKELESKNLVKPKYQPFKKKAKK